MSDQRAWPLAKHLKEVLALVKDMEEGDLGLWLAFGPLLNKLGPNPGSGE